MTERELFEQWRRKSSPNVDLTRHGEDSAPSWVGRYTNPPEESMWFAWSSSPDAVERERLTKALMDVRDALNYDDPNSYVADDRSGAIDYAFETAKKALENEVAT